mmetsp:Transcript_34148/g.51523  ORF Transcript_34148/g.51523 Transcript_34148/m.51523 type:complete len:126 (-) Transcript_34148:317-694(-)
MIYKLEYWLLLILRFTSALKNLASMVALVEAVEIYERAEEQNCIRMKKSSTHFIILGLLYYSNSKSTNSFKKTSDMKETLPTAQTAPASSHRHNQELFQIFPLLKQSFCIIMILNFLCFGRSCVP